MKTPINTSITAIVAFVLLSFSAQSADLIVEPNALPPNYSSISEAVDSAINGDRIIIKNKPGNVPWVEDVTIDKSLTFLSYANDTFFKVQGNYTIKHAPGREVTINGMKNTQGNITANSNGSGGETLVNIVNSHLQNGYIYFRRDNFKLIAASNKVDGGGIGLYYGQVIGNEVNGGSVYVRTGDWYTNISDTVKVIGNKINVSGVNAISIYSDSVYAYVLNNYINGGGGSSDYGIVFIQTRNGATSNLIYNNTIENVANGIHFTTGYASNNFVVEIINNVIGDSYYSSSGSKGIYIYSSNPKIYAYYNYIDGVFSTAIDANVTSSSENVIQSISVQSDGSLPSSSPAIDGGYPTTQFYDLDLTVGDAGAYGGSYTLDNFFPLFNGSARVYNVRSPFKVKQGNSFSIEGDSYDR